MSVLHLEHNLSSARGNAYTTETNSEGAYYLTHVPIGTYQVKVEAKVPNCDALAL